ncbi:thioredoxin family protein [Patescibacteria group bacterium]|nr:thioredoxin family protein [Patescibacteria group bacterium]
MVKTQSTMIALGTKIPYFRLPDVVSGNIVSSDDPPDKKAILAMFICNHCPYVKHVQEEIAKIGKDYVDKSLSIVAISSNDIEQYPDDAPGNLKKQAQDLGFNFPYLFDETQSVAKAFTAACTPDFFLFNEKRELAYRGQLDDSRPGNDAPVNGKDLREAIDLVLVGKRVSEQQKPSAGCNVKWKVGNEPLYFV